MTDSLVVIGSVMGAVLIIAFVAIRLLCRAGIRRTSPEGRRRAAKKEERIRMKLLKKRKKAEVEDTGGDDDNDEDAGVEEEEVSPRTLLRRRESESEDDEANEVAAEFDDDIANLASKKLLLPKAASYETAPPSMAKSSGAFVPMPARTVDLSEATVYRPPPILWNAEEESFGFAPVRPTTSQQRGPTVAAGSTAPSHAFEPPRLLEPQG
eukprot:CAMPEP_0174839168 /NCGR_PEP_ID=MMETSP1114-20130205/7872_1 /TAXON_ID=312471 /ORGANISM="Neobodo designis, Strain CCAP 1951/1" /LENGTH=209 /DNA_ID=CAMNT_0016073289 /DNA_START=41 /DNA_END=667 /DNA_ORIENTATION=+